LESEKQVGVVKDTSEVQGWVKNFVRQQQESGK